MRATEQRAGGGHQGTPKKRPGTAIRGAEIPARARQTDIEGHGAAHWRGLPRRPEKAAWDRYSGRQRYQPAPARAARPKLGASEQRADEATKAP